MGSLVNAAKKLWKYTGKTLLFGWRKFLAAPASKKSLRCRLSIYFSLVLVAAWIIAALLAWKECREHMDEFFDSQQMLFAKTLAVTSFKHSPVELPNTKQVLPGVKKKYWGDLEDEAIAFAVFSPSGQVVLTDGQKGRRFPFEPKRRGFINMRLKGDDDTWRILWLDSADGTQVIAVGQEIDFRQEMALEMLGNQLIPWLLLLPVLLLGLFVLLSRELAPLHAIASDLQSRAPENTTQLDVSKVPLEVVPMAESLNGFFTRTNAMLTRERSFISDAAHELRTPLSGLRVQAQVAAQQDISPEIRNEALLFLKQGADRCSRLVEQLLALSRLDALRPVDAPYGAPLAGLSLEAINWASLLEECVAEYRPKIKNRGVHLTSRIVSLNSTARGYPALAATLLRNIIENAANYTPEQGHIRVTLEQNRLVVQNDCTNLPDAYISRLGERFFRPPGQEEPGSGLGLSISRRIADLHRFSLDIRMKKNVPELSTNAFTVILAWQP